MKPEEKARQKIDHLLSEAGWEVQDRNELNLSAGVGVAVREYQTEVGPADYILFVDRKPVGVIEAKKSNKKTPHSTFRCKISIDKQKQPTYASTP